MNNSKRVILLCILLSAITLAAFWPVIGCDFISLDDPDYLTQNPRVSSGLTWSGVSWAFTTGHASNWHPLTWLSLMAGCELHGLNSAGHHLANLGLHLFNTLILFALLKRITGTDYRSALVAVFFAVHPLHVESVAWVCERKDLLSTFFGLASLWAYAHYAEPKALHNPIGSTCGKVAPPRRKFAIGRSTLFYTLALLFFAMSLLSKSMLVTLPFVMLLLDYWPLRRLKRQDLFPTWRDFRRLLPEKIPFFALTVASSVITMLVQQRGGAFQPLGDLSVSDRFENALVSYLRYLGCTAFPNGLSIYYPHPGIWPNWQVAGAAILLLCITVTVLRASLKRPYLLIGWLWFLGTLVPVIGLIQVGGQSIADRYTYFPLIGLFIAMVYGAVDWATYHKAKILILIITLAATISACGVLTNIQAQRWQNTETLFRHALVATSNNPTAQFILGCALTEKGDMEEGMAHLSEALRLRPDFVEVYARLGFLFTIQGRVDNAISCYHQALHFKPDFSEVLNNLAWLRATHQDKKFRNGPEAVQLAERAVQLSRGEKPVYLGTLAAALAEAGRFAEAITTAEKARDTAAALGERDVVNSNEALLQLYRTGQAYHDISPSR